MEMFATRESNAKWNWAMRRLVWTDFVNAKAEVITFTRLILVTKPQVSTFLRLGCRLRIPIFHFYSTEIGEYCKFDNNCIGDDTFCKYGKCKCPFGTHSSLNLSVCMKNVELGEKCMEDEECVAEDSKCHDVCRCRTSHIISSNGKECLPSE